MKSLSESGGALLAVHPSMLGKSTSMWRTLEQGRPGASSLWDQASRSRHTATLAPCIVPCVDTRFLLQRRFKGGWGPRAYKGESALEDYGNMVRFAASKGDWALSLQLLEASGRCGRSGPCQALLGSPHMDSFLFWERLFGPFRLCEGQLSMASQEVVLLGLLLSKRWAL